MNVEIQGVIYQFTRGSDVAHDGMFLEAHVVGEPDNILLFAFRSDTSEEFTFSAFRQNLPFELVEKFIQQARKMLPPITACEE